MKFLRDAKIGDRVKIPLNEIGTGFVYRHNPHSGGCNVVVLKHDAGWGTYVGWEEGKKPANLPDLFDVLISTVDRESYGLDPKFKYGFRIDAGVEIQMLKPTKKTSSAGFLLSCIGVGTALSALSQSMLGSDQEGIERSETLGS